MRARISVLSLILVAVLATPVLAQETGPHRAGVVVVHGDGSITSRCVTFSEESISGAEVLLRSGLGVTLGAYGGLGYGVCGIGDEGCLASQDCFCKCRGSPCAYWVYSHLGPDGSWTISGVGASGWQVHDGDVDGWVWGDGSAAPPAVAFEEVCSSQGSGPTEPTATAPPSGIATPVPKARLTIEGVEKAEPSSQPAASERSPTVWGYGVLGAVILGLVGWLTMAIYRGGHV